MLEKEANWLCSRTALLHPMLIVSELGYLTRGDAVKRSSGVCQEVAEVAHVGLVTSIGSTCLLTKATHKGGNPRARPYVCALIFLSFHRWQRSCSLGRVSNVLKSR